MNRLHNQGQSPKRIDDIKTIAEAFRFFECNLEAMKSETNGADYSEDAIALMHPLDFLRLAPPVAERINSQERYAAINSALAQTGKLRGFPCLEVEWRGDSLSVVGHDGRHRSSILCGKANLIPVIVTIIAEDEDDPDALRLLNWAMSEDCPVYPEQHDEDEVYLNDEGEPLDEDDLDDRIAPVAARRFFENLYTWQEIAAALEGRSLASEPAASAASPSM